MQIIDMAENQENSTEAILVKSVLFCLCLIKHKHELSSYLSACPSNGHSSSRGSASLIKADRCSPLAPNHANHKQNSLANVFPIQAAAITNRRKVHLVPAVGVFVYLLLCVCVWPVLPHLMREILIAPGTVAHGNQCLICRLLDKGFNAETCPHPLLPYSQ